MRVTDAGRTARDNVGRVAFSSDVSIILPTDRSRGSGRLMLDVVNRGNRVALPNFNSFKQPTINADVSVDFDISLGNGFLMERGYTVVACGWQGDTPAFPALITMDGPDAENDSGGPPRREGVHATPERGGYAQLPAFRQGPQGIPCPRHERGRRPPGSARHA